MTKPLDTANTFISKLNAFVSLSEVEKAYLAQISAKPRSVDAGTDLIREGDPPNGVFLILEGFACRYKVRANGSRQIMAYLVPGDMCDLDVALLARMDHSISTLSACRVVHIETSIIEVLLSYPQIARALRMNTLVDAATLREWLVNVGCRSAPESIAHLLCELLVRLEVVSLATGNAYDLPITQTDIADTTGLSNVHVNRSLKELRGQGLIELKKRRLQILDLPALKALAEFKSNYLHVDTRAAA